MTKVNETHIVGPPPLKKKIITDCFTPFIYICVWIEKFFCGLRENFILFAYGVGGGIVPRPISGHPPPTTSPLNLLMTYYCITWLVTYNNTIL